MKILKYLLYIISSLIPKSNKMVIIPYPDWEDMTIAIYEKIKVQEKYNKIIYLVSHNLNNPAYIKLSLNTIIKRRRSLIGIWHMITAKYLLITNGSSFNKVPHGMKIINLWHGIGYKAVGALDRTPNGITCSLCFAPSESIREIFAKQMNIDISNVIALGFSRNDRLYDSFLIKNELKLKLNFHKYNSIIFWMPTYRVSIEGDIRQDGLNYNNPFNLSNFNLSDFKEFLLEHKILCLFRTHPMSLKYNISYSSTFINISDNWLYDHQISLYQLLGLSDMLISDLSSVIFDYLIIDKPIIHALSDFEEYIESRHMVFSPTLDYLAGPLVTNQDNLYMEINYVLSNVDNFKQKRNELRKIIFDNNTENKSAGKICNYLNEI